MKVFGNLPERTRRRTVVSLLDEAQGAHGGPDNYQERGTLGPTIPSRDS
jgi:hypothetical protein